MVVEKNLSVSLEYSIFDSNNKLIDSSEKSGILTYVHGFGQIMKGIEEVLEGKGIGSEFSGLIPPEKAYGIYDPKNVYPVSIMELPKPEEGFILNKQYEFNLGSEIKIMTVLGIDHETVILDANHIYAGEEIFIRCKILDISINNENFTSICSTGCSSCKSCGCKNH